jgi:hypothetical protein
MMELKHSDALQAATINSKFGLRCRNFVAYLTDWRVILPGFLIAGFAAGILSAFVISGSHPVAVVHQGPYALTGLYKGEVYELIPMEDAIRLRQKQRKQQKARIRTIGNRNPVIEDLILPSDHHRAPITNGPH